MLPASRNRRHLEELAAGLAGLDLRAALRPLSAARQMLRGDVAWPQLWRRVNEVFLGTPIGDLEPALDHFLLAVADPVRMARTLAETTRLSPDEPVPVAGIVTAGNVYRIVAYDPGGERFYLRITSRPWRPISWDEVRAHAAAGRSGGPSRVVTDGKNALFSPRDAVPLAVPPVPRRPA